MDIIFYISDQIEYVSIESTGEALAVNAVLIDGECSIRIPAAGAGATYRTDILPVFVLVRDQLIPEVFPYFVEFH